MSQPSADPGFRLRWKAFGVYEGDRTDFDQARAVHPEPDSERQSLEASVMDVADDITYALHDLEDFYQAGLFDGARAATELRAWEFWAKRPVAKRQNSNVDGSGSTFAKLWAELGADYPGILEDGRDDASLRGARALIEGTV